MARLHLEGAVIGPQVNRSRDRTNATLIDHFDSLCSANGEFKICILLPVPEEERKLVEEAVLDVAHQLERGGTRVTRYSTLELGSAKDCAQARVQWLIS